MDASQSGLHLHIDVSMNDAGDFELGRVENERHPGLLLIIADCPGLESGRWKRVFSLKSLGTNSRNSIFIHSLFPQIPRRLEPAFPYIFVFKRGALRLGWFWPVPS